MFTEKKKAKKKLMKWWNKIQNFNHNPHDNLQIWLTDQRTKWDWKKKKTKELFSSDNSVKLTEFFLLSNITTQIFENLVHFWIYEQKCLEKN